MADIRLSKGHGLGNDYLVVDAALLPSPLTPARVRWLCDRHRGVGADGVLLADLGGGGVALRIFNPDGSEAEKSGNGLRIFAAWLHARGRARTGEWLEVRLARDTVRLRVEEAGPQGVLRIRAELGRAVFEGDVVAFGPRAEATLDYKLELPAGGSARINTVSVGNPHCVVFVPALERADFLARAPQLCTHPAFAHGVNVQFARVAGPGRIEAWVWERGAGETLASGSSASAVAAAAVRRGLVAPGEVAVVMPGGTADIEVTADYRVALTGPAQLVCEVTLLPGAATAFLAAG